MVLGLGSYLVGLGSLVSGLWCRCLVNRDLGGNATSIYPVSFSFIQSPFQQKESSSECKQGGN